MDCKAEEDGGEEVDECVPLVLGRHCGGWWGVRELAFEGDSGEVASRRETKTRTRNGF